MIRAASSRNMAMMDVSNLRSAGVGREASRFIEASNMKGILVFGEETVPLWNPTWDKEIPMKKLELSPGVTFKESVFA
jgi:hypothetical protein